MELGQSSEKHHILEKSLHLKSVDKSGNPSPVSFPAKARNSGINVLTTVALVVGEVAGTGILALPFSIESTGPIGIVLIPLLALVSSYTATILCRCWTLVQEQHEEYRGHVRQPYPIIGQLAFGRPGRLLVSLSLDLSMAGAGVVFLIIASQNVQDLLVNLFQVRISFCYLLLAVTAVLTPLTWLGTPKDFWGIGLTAATATVIATVILMYLEFKDSLGPYKEVSVQHTPIGALTFFQGVGVIFFAYGGHAVFPTIQNDMKQPTQFGKAATAALMVTAVLYSLAAVPAYFIYGNHLDPNVTRTISPSPLLYVVQILITGHVCCALIIVINPVVQEIEELLKIKKQCSWTRLVARTGLMGLMLFIAETVPRFDAILALIGGTVMVTLSCIAPCLFYMRLAGRQGDKAVATPLPLHVKVALIEIVCVAVVMGVIASVSAINTMVSPDTFSWPCYVNVTSADGRTRS